jgi:hypothetical protein
MTPKQIELARHALGLDGRRRQTFRNHFVTGPGSSDYGDWEAMVAAGLARKSPGSPLTGGDPIFRLTRAGADRALLPGETLSPEDWPA